MKKMAHFYPSFLRVPPERRWCRRLHGQRSSWRQWAVAPPSILRPLSARGWPQPGPVHWSNCSSATGTNSATPDPRLGSSRSGRGAEEKKVNRKKCVNLFALSFFYISSRITTKSFWWLPQFCYIMSNRSMRCISIENWMKRWRNLDSNAE